MEKKDIIFLVGEKMGGFVSEMHSLIEKTDGAGKSFGKSVKNLLEKSKNSFSDFDIFRLNMEGKKDLSLWEEKRGRLITKIGEEVYRLKKSGKEFPQEISGLLKSVLLCESEMERIKEELSSRKKQKEKGDVIRQAVKNLKSGDARQRIVALRVLEKIGDRKILCHIIDSLDDPEEEVSERAAEMLRKLLKHEVDVNNQ